jgi:hypothetical protein
MSRRQPCIIALVRFPLHPMYRDLKLVTYCGILTTVTRNAGLVALLISGGVTRNAGPVASRDAVQISQQMWQHRDVTPAALQ